ncbi:MAG: isoprenylcysteine carboxylmethyltransferase family protein [Ideonella sp.]|jgi:protein-S-isoprenylcysteine O-methyltransferase Ste14|nr:isoprenylcysteine carboxylmethyltransferase family protein [Ideonella sp.]
MPRLEARVPPPVLLALIATAMWMASSVPPHWTLLPLSPWALPLALFAVGLAINAAGFRAIRKAGSTIDPTRPESASSLVVTGPFRISRNPMYLGFTVMLLAWAAYLQSLWTLAGPVLFVAYVDRLQIVPEEHALRRKFGADFDRYAAHVRRWL